ncbi:glutathione S-transferase family protein [Aestuariivirga litoralis]|uniref:glutathione S-transferase family protein n=1 Tax=Aestuariivirga litoralis TaxID=2650924 RepID=UPI0018C6B980|nr:glutathione S-transferase family protein [Aestuariivirga litoralis]MBG1231608.1 glutathione S-transferase family protein [Aestuariivirga litoralis]
MATPLLIIGNKNYSSWSLRPYMALAGAGIAFDEKMIRFGEPQFSKTVKRISKAGLVPILKHNGLVIWETLAIMEYIAETWPEKNLWPKNKAARALARSMCSEMHAGFRHIRNACPMNLRRPPKQVPMTDGIRADVARLESLWADARKAYGKGGPFLFGKFSNADAMFAPVVTRLDTYAIPVSKQSRAYMDAILQSPAFRSWLTEALKEKWIVPEDEVD